jgi:hypothetical protein
MVDKSSLASADHATPMERDKSMVDKSSSASADHASPIVPINPWWINHHPLQLIMLPQWYGINPWSWINHHWLKLSMLPQWYQLPMTGLASAATVFSGSWDGLLVHNNIVKSSWLCWCILTTPRRVLTARAVLVSQLG